MTRNVQMSEQRPRAFAAVAILLGLLAVVALVGWALDRDEPGLAPAPSGEALSSETGVLPGGAGSGAERAPGGSSETDPAAASGPGSQEGAEGSGATPWESELAAAREGDNLRVHRSLLARLILDEKIALDDRARLLEELTTVNQRLFSLRGESEDLLELRVKPGSSFHRIKNELRREREIAVSSGMLEEINQIDARRLKAGQLIRVPKEPVSVLVDKSDRMLYLLIGGVPFRWYPVGIGREQRTPEGEFTLGGKTKNPNWTDPATNKLYRYGEEGHLIGSRWIQFWDRGTPTSFGIHGTVDPSSIGKALSDGCIRMGKQEVEELYDLVHDQAAITVRP